MEKRTDIMEKYVKKLLSVSDVRAIVLFGSAACYFQGKRNIFDEVSDIDILVILYSKDFTTNPNSLRKIAKLFPTSERINIIVKTVPEFSKYNVVSLTPSFIEHLYSIGIILFEEGFEIDSRIREVMQEKKFKILRRIAAPMLSYTLEIRQRVINMFRNPYLQPKLSYYLYHQARNLLGIKLEEEKDNWRGVIEEFYKKIGKGSIEKHIQIRRTIGNCVKIEQCKKAFIKFKGIIERDLWNFNWWLIRHQEGILEKLKQEIYEVLGS